MLEIIHLITKQYDIKKVILYENGRIVNINVNDCLIFQLIMTKYLSAEQVITNFDMDYV